MTSESHKTTEKTGKADKTGSGWRIGLLFVSVAVLVSLALAWSMGLIGSREAAVQDRLSNDSIIAAEDPYPLDMPDLANDVAPGTDASPEADNTEIAVPEPRPATAPTRPKSESRPKSILPNRQEVIRAPRPADTTRAAATRAVPVQALDRLFTRADYPAAARAARQEGTTTVALGVDAAGRAITCRVAASSGSVALDAATCRVLVARARFTPAIDASGARTSDLYVQRIRWNR